MSFTLVAVLLIHLSSVAESSLADGPEEPQEVLHHAMDSGTPEHVHEHDASALLAVAANGDVVLQRGSRAARSLGVALSQAKAVTPWSTTGVEHSRVDATVHGEPLCDSNHYKESQMEALWRSNANEWTESQQTLCGRLNGSTGEWMSAMAGELAPTTSIFSKLCLASREAQLLEPLAGILRSPRVFCSDPDKHLYDVDFLVLADARSAGLQPGARRLFFDAGGSNFGDAMRWFTSAYAARGITFDHIFVWEATKRGKEEYWRGVAPDVRSHWEPRLTFYDGVPVTADLEDADNNVVERIKRECSPGDFCAWKLDIDTPSVELPLVQQLMGSAEAQARVDEFFFEHHVHGIMQKFWGRDVDRTFADSYAIFSKLRSQGVRAHSWI